MTTSQLLLSQPILYGIPLAAILVGAIQAIKECGVPSRFAPIIALALGIGLACLIQVSAAHPDYLEGVVTGAALGLSASGIYSGVKAFAASGNPASAPPPK